MTKQERTEELQTGSWQAIKAAAIAVFGEDYEKPDGESWEDQIGAIIDAEFSKKKPAKKSPAATETVEPKQDFNYVKQGNLWVCQACGVQVQTNSKNQKVCPVKNNKCPREAN